MESKFDGCAVKEATFAELYILQRFFTENGQGYTKESNCTCYDDYGFESIHVHPDSKVFIKIK